MILPFRWSLKTMIWKEKKLNQMKGHRSTDLLTASTSIF